jgi:penicillin amidase
MRRKKRGIYYVLLILSMGWIVGTFYGPMGLNGLGSLLTFGSGLAGLESPDAEPGTIEIDTEGQYSCSVKIDSFGVPHIYGAKAKDVGFGMGYVQARDRYIQMELMTRVASGKISEFVGDKGLDSDIFWRKFDFEEKAKRDLENLKNNYPKHYEYLLSYNAGIEYYLANEAPSEREFGYNLLGQQPRKWEAHYGFLVPYYMSHMLAYKDWKLGWQVALQKLPENVLDALFDFRHEEYPYIHPAFAPSDTVIAAIPMAPLQTSSFYELSDLGSDYYDNRDVEASIGSNNWAVSPARSISGKAMLCNDTHLKVSFPGPWYEAHLVSDDFHTYGFTIPGSPHIISGTNENIAWGETNGAWDLNDWFILEINPKNTNQYKLDGTWTNFESKTLSIGIKGKPDHEVTLLSTVHGFVDTIGEEVFATRWHCNTQNTVFLAVSELAYASNEHEFDQALSYFNYPPQNVVYADIEGNIGLISAGSMPVHDEDYNGEFLDGTTSKEWSYVPHSENLRTVNPAEGFVESANQNPGFPDHYLNFTWSMPWRGHRIREVFNERPAFTVAEMAALHTDITDASFSPFIRLFNKHFPNPADLPDFVSPLMGWDGAMEHDKYEPFLYHFMQGSVQDVMQQTVFDEFGAVDYLWYDQVLRYLAANDTIRIGSTVMPTKAMLEKIVAECERHVIEDLGYTNPTEHLYSEISAFEIDHLLRLPGLGAKISDKGGSANTPNVNTRKSHGASMRTIFEMGSPVIAHTILPGGQSGRANSLNHTNQLDMYLKGEYRTFAITSDPAAVTAVQTLEIK